MGTVSMFDALIIISGIYLLYTAIVMKTQGKITAGVLVSKDVNINKIRDKEGFIGYMFGKVLTMGILTCAVGAGGYLINKYNGPLLVSIVGIAVYIFILILFSVSASRARKLFID